MIVKTHRSESALRDVCSVFSMLSGCHDFKASVRFEDQMTTLVENWRNVFQTLLKFQVKLLWCIACTPEGPAALEPWASKVH